MSCVKKESNLIQRRLKQSSICHAQSARQTSRDLMGMVNYNNKFIPDVSTRSAPLRALEENKNQWSWGPEQESAWNDLRTALTSEPVLRFYDPKKKTKISADASQTGLGAVLLQQDEGSDLWGPVAYASKAMQDSETRYAQIEKECLALTYACERFHQFIYGMKFKAETDHKPLIAIFKKTTSR